MPKRRTVKGWGFVPDPLPPRVEVSELLVDLFPAVLEAERNLSLLEGTASRLDNPHVLMGAFNQREAILSSKIENTVASAEDLALIDRAPGGVENPDAAREVRNYLRALELGVRSELPISLRLLRDMHRVLLQGVRRSPGVNPGEFRTTQNLVGGSGTLASARYVPPPPEHVDECLNQLERYIHQTDPHWPRLIRFGLVHYQFEAIHPFGDGNGRLGRLLISLMLCQQAQLSKPLVYVSAYFEEHRERYYELLYRVSTHGDWRSWLAFFLEAVATQAADAVERANRLLDLREDYLGRVQEKRSSALLARFINQLFTRPSVTTDEASHSLGCTVQNASVLIQKLVGKGVLAKITGRRRGRVWVAPEILDLIQSRG